MAASTEGCVNTVTYLSVKTWVQHTASTEGRVNTVTYIPICEDLHWVGTTMSMPWRKKRSKKNKNRASQQVEDTTSHRPESPTAKDINTLPTVVITESRDDKENTLTAVSLPPPSQPSKYKRQIMRSKDTSDSGISSGSKPSTSTLSTPFHRPRSFTNSSAESSSYFTPQGSINESSPNEQMPLQFPGIDEQYSPPTSNPLLQSMKEKIEELSDLVKTMSLHLDTLTVRIENIEKKITDKRLPTISTETQTVDFRQCTSLPDISEVRTHYNIASK